ncbi:hypothetical protein [Pseudomonas sp. Leaf48]|uniref:hypothetical protein n=1 Tax=Pseudomonas sp. Leaf48 TaxID=1736221 RepID=UPI000B169D11|nr:hypothetical protein [Pseudomonas sp. Leaf48]
MPIDLRALPQKRVQPTPPGKWRWCLVVLLCAVLGAGLVIWLWPEDSVQMSLWFWCCVLVFPLIPGLLLFAFRRMAYERQQDFVQSWNQHLNELEQGLIEQGQRRLALLTPSYCTPAANNRLAQALRSGSKPLQPTYLSDSDTTLRLSQLKPAAQRYTLEDYTQRLTKYFRQVIAGFDEDLQRLVGNTPLRLRIKHNRILDDEQVLALWRECAGETWTVDQVAVVDDDGLVWLDAWLDDPSPPALVLSVEVQLFQQPTAQQAESVSILLLAQPEWCVGQKVVPDAWVHRPVVMTDEGDSLEDALLWGQVKRDGESCFAWQTQIPGDRLRNLNIALGAAGQPHSTDRCQMIDDAFGLPGRAVGNLALIIASEYAVAQSQPQLIMLQDVSPQWCVVRPAG